MRPVCIVALTFCAFVFVLCLCFVAPVWPFSPSPCRLSAEGRGVLRERWAPVTPAAFSAQLAGFLRYAFLTPLSNYLLAPVLRSWFPWSPASRHARILSVHHAVKWVLSPCVAFRSCSFPMVLFGSAFSVVTFPSEGISFDTLIEFLYVSELSVNKPIVDYTLQLGPGSLSGT